MDSPSSPQTKIYTLDDELEMDLNFFSRTMHDIIEEMSVKLGEAVENNFSKVTTNLQEVRDSRRDIRMFELARTRFPRLLRENDDLHKMAENMLEAQFPRFSCSIVIKKKRVELVFRKKAIEES